MKFFKVISMLLLSGMTVSYVSGAEWLASAASLCGVTLPSEHQFKSVGSSLLGAAVGYALPRPRNNTVRIALGAGVGYGAYKLYHYWHGGLSGQISGVSQQVTDVEGKVVNGFYQVIQHLVNIDTTQGNILASITTLFDYVKKEMPKLSSLDSRTAQMNQHLKTFIIWNYYSQKQNCQIQRENRELLKKMAVHFNIK